MAPGAGIHAASTIQARLEAFLVRYRQTSQRLRRWLQHVGTLASLQVLHAFITFYRQVPSIIDGTRQSDGLLVSLKAVDTSVHPFEVEIGQFLSSEPLAKDPRNHSVCIIDVLQDPIHPNVTILVMPLLKKYDVPELSTVGEVVAFCKQAIEVGKQ